jgi:hypothetical protein
MKLHIFTCSVFLGVVAGGRALGGDHESCPPPEAHFLKRLRPVGGWNPYGGGVFHWWKRECFPRCGGPDDYCRKPPPNVCWPAYPPCYIWGSDHRIVDNRNAR